MRHGSVGRARLPPSRVRQWMFSKDVAAQSELRLPVGAEWRNVFLIRSRQTGKSVHVKVTGNRLSWRFVSLARMRSDFDLEIVDNLVPLNGGYLLNDRRIDVLGHKSDRTVRHQEVAPTTKWTADSVGPIDVGLLRKRDDGRRASLSPGAG